MNTVTLYKRVRPPDTFMGYGEEVEYFDSFKELQASFSQPNDEVYVATVNWIRLD